MALINNNFLKLPQNYLFSDIAKKVNAYKTVHPQAKIISLGIGDVTLPLPQESIKALHKACDEMSDRATFKGYGPEQGYRFLREKIIKHEYESLGIHLDPDEVFISDGAKSDTGNIGDILSKDNRVAVTDPVYPVYIDSNVMGCRAGDLMENGCWSNIVYIPCTPENKFIPELPTQKVDIIYLCFPNNPTGTTLTKSQLKEWVDYALKNDVLILFDAAYEAYITEKDIPHSIYEIKGAKKVAIEFRSFSKTAGFTGTRCGYTIIPKELAGYTKDEGKPVSLNMLWNRRQCTKFNGTPYIVQRAAEALFTPEGKKETRLLIDYYLNNAKIIRESLTYMGLEVYGGINSPYIWLKTPEGLSSWKMFERLLYEVNIVSTPGVGFGPKGEGFIRLTAFGNKDETIEAMERIKQWKI